MEKRAIWICDCGKETEQDPKQKPIEKCSCGKALRKIKSPDGIINEHFIAPEWFLKQFDEQDQRMRQSELGFQRAAFQLVGILRGALELYDKVQLGNKAMQRVVDEGVRRLKLNKKELQWHFNRGIARFIGFKKPEKRV